MGEKKHYSERLELFIEKLDKLYPNEGWVTKFARNCDMINFSISPEGRSINTDPNIRQDLGGALMNLVERLETLNDKPKVPEKIDDLGIILEVWERTIDGHKSRGWKLTNCFMATEGMLFDMAVRFDTTSSILRDKFVRGESLVKSGVIWKPQKARGSVVDPLMG